MKLKRFIQTSLLLLPSILMAQYQFTGVVNLDNLGGKIYLSVVEDYRKISGVHPEQILNQTIADSTGYFSFNGNNLPSENKIYRIHIDNCSEADQKTSHFTGHCPNSKEVIFVANNNTALSLPFSFEDQMFCTVVSTNEKANSFLKIDSLKNDMRFAFGTYRSEANRKLNSKKWFSILQQYGEQLHEPLAELYGFAFFSDRSSDLYGYYLEDLKANPYYDNLLVRLKAKYPDTQYVKQYAAELESDRHLVATQSPAKLPWWAYLIGGTALLSILGNFYFFGKMKKLKNANAAKQSLTQQENKILDLILQDKTNKEIANHMFVSVSTVKTHINNLYKKLQVGSRDEVKSLYSS
ncbi:MAG: helix-turn-helix transcriptional regulator [Flavobacteriaceae bacterium]|nr:helix-turn-helix transcriptional regulator [Flavobacteriaceae bacterium]